MIPASRVVDLVLDAARADETIVLVTDRTEASLRWANNSMTTNGVSTSRSTTVISILREGDSAQVGSLRSTEVDPSLIPALVAASVEAARSAPKARDAAPLLPGSGAPDDWDSPVPVTEAEVFAGIADSLSRGFGAPTSCTGSRITWSKRRCWHPRPGCAGATPSRPARWRSMPNVTRPARGQVSVHPISPMCQWICCSSSSLPDWAGQRGPSSCPPVATRRSCPVHGGRHDDLHGVDDERPGAQEGRTAFSAPGGGTRVGSD